MRRKGKIHPSPSSSSPIAHHSSINKNAMAMLKLLPVAILALVSVLSIEDSQVLAYMISRSIKATNPFVEENSKKNAKKLASSNHKIPNFDCECFDCYTSYWFRWDSSPNREVIHKAIEAFEEHLYDDEQLKKGKNKKKYKMGRHGNGKLAEIEVGNQSSELKNQSPEFKDKSFYEQGSSETEVTELNSAEIVSKSTEVVGLSKAVALEKDVKPEKEVVVLRGGGGANNYKGLARKVLPDVLGLFNSRLWRLWSPNV